MMRSKIEVLLQGSFITKSERSEMKEFCAKWYMGLSQLTKNFRFGTMTNLFLGEIFLISEYEIQSPQDLKAVYRLIRDLEKKRFGQTRWMVLGVVYTPSGSSRSYLLGLTRFKRVIYYLSNRGCNVVMNTLHQKIVMELSHGLGLNLEVKEFGIGLNNRWKRDVLNYLW